MAISPSIRYRISAPAGKPGLRGGGNARVCMENLRLLEGYHADTWEPLRIRDAHDIPSTTSCAARRRAGRIEPAMRGRFRALVLVAAISLAGCGGANVTQSPTPPAGTVAPDSSPTTDAPASAITITRSGGIAGVNDVVEIAADGSTQVTRKTGIVSACTPTAEAISRLRAIDIAAIGTAMPKNPIVDGFTYEIVTAAGGASVGDGDGGPRGELLSAAAEVVVVPHDPVG